LKNAAAGDVFTMVTGASEFELPVTSTFFPIADVSRDRYKSQVFLAGLFHELAPFVEANSHSFPLFGWRMAIPSRMIEGLVATEGRNRLPATRLVGEDVEYQPVGILTLLVVG
jgi:ribosome modulation factor